MLRERNGAGNRIAPRGGEFPFFPPRGPNAGRVSACHRFPRFAGVGVARHTRSGSIATGRCFASVPFHICTCRPRRFLYTFCHCGSRGIRDFICMRDRAPLLEPGGGLEGGPVGGLCCSRSCVRLCVCGGVCSSAGASCEVGALARLSLSDSFSLSLWELKLKFAKRNVTKQYSWGPSYNPSTRWQSRGDGHAGAGAHRARSGPP